MFRNVLGAWKHFVMKIVGFLMIPQPIPTYRSIGTEYLQIFENHRKSSKIMKIPDFRKLQICFRYVSTSFLCMFWTYLRFRNTHKRHPRSQPKNCIQNPNVEVRKISKNTKILQIIENFRKSSKIMKIHDFSKTSDLF